jgi:hypothetical protein
VPDTTAIETSLNNIKSLWITFKQFESQICTSVGDDKAYDHINELIESLTKTREAISGLNKYDPLKWAVVKQAVEGTLNGIFILFQQRASNPPQLMAVMMQQLGSLYAAYDMLVTMLPNSSPFFKGSNEDKKKIIHQVQWLNDRIQETDEITKSIVLMQEKSSLYAEKGGAIYEEFGRLIALTKEKVEKIIGYVNEASAAKKNIEENTATAEDELQLIKSVKIEMITTKEAVDSLYERMKSNQVQIDELLKFAVMKGMATAFRNRKDRLERAGNMWLMLFFAGLGGLSFIGEQLTGHLINARIYSFATILHLFVVGPFVWWAWFSARQYGRTSRLQEDYAFKEASAMAYIGYRDEMGDKDDELLSYLQKSAIRTFSENPAKINDLNADPASPLHDVIQKVNLKDLNDVLSKLLVLLKLK